MKKKRGEKNMKGFKKFIETGKKAYFPRVSIWKRGQISFNVVFTKISKLNNFSYAILFFNEKTRQIGIKFTNDANEEGAIKIVGSRKSNAWLGSIAFCKCNKINYPTRLKNPKFSDEENFWIMDLEE